MGKLMARGRRRKDARRHPSGEIARPGRAARAAKKEEDMTSVGRQARERVRGIPKRLSGVQDAGDALGYLALIPAEFGISFRQRDAGRLYAEIMRDWDAAILARKVFSGSNLDRTGGHDNSDGASPAEVERYERAKGRMKRARRAILLSGEPTAQTVLDAVVLEDKDMWGHVGTLRVALNAIAHEFPTELTRAA